MIIEYFVILYDKRFFKNNMHPAPSRQIKLLSDGILSENIFKMHRL